MIWGGGQTPPPLLLYGFSYPVVGYVELNGQVRLTVSSHFNIRNHPKDNDILLVGSARGNQGAAGCFLLSAV